MEIVVHEIATDGLPDMDSLTGRVAFIFDGCIVSGWPLRPHLFQSPADQWRWEADSDVGNGRIFAGVTHWVEFPVPVRQIEKPT